MLKKAIFLTSAALGVSSFMACSESDSVKADATSENSCSMISTEKDGIEISCGGEVVGHIKTSADKVYGASCNAEALKDDSGYRIVCGGDSVGVVYNGDHGRNGEPGSNGNPGTSCYAEKSAEVDGYDVFCGDDLIGYLYNGKQGLEGKRGERGETGKDGKDGVSCTTSKNTLTGVATITCTDGTVATVKDGTNGLNGDDGESCSLNPLTRVITCGESSITVANGTNGNSCATTSDADSVYVSCTDSEGEVVSSTAWAIPSNGVDGINGNTCSAITNTDGDVEITCGVLDTCVAQKRYTNERDFYQTVCENYAKYGEPINLDNPTCKKTSTGSCMTTSAALGSTIGDNDTAYVFVWFISSTVTVSAGAPGKSAYEIYVSGLTASDDTLTQAEWLASMKGGNGKSAYEIYVATTSDDPVMTETEWLAALSGSNGLSAYEIYKKNNPLSTLTESQWLASLSGSNGDNGYGCSATSGTGYVTVKCQTGVDADDNAIYDEQTIYAAGYAACGDVAYNTTTQTCEAGVPTDIPAVVPTCGEDPLSDDQFCEADVAYDKADYWTEATSYPKAVYGKCGDGYYEKASQFCSVYNKTEDLCGTKDYNPALQYCDDVTDPAAPVVKNISAVCGAVLYDVREQFCYDDGAGDKAYNKTDYWDETTDYPVADYECPDAPDMSTCILK